MHARDRGRPTPGDRISDTRLLPCPPGGAARAPRRRMQSRAAGPLCLMAMIASMLWLGVAGAEPASAGPFSGDTDPMNDPERTAEAFTSAVTDEAIRAGPPFTFTTLPTALPYSTSPAYADILVESARNMLPCEGGPFALCFYSGPDGPLPCRTSPGDPLSECTCIEVAYGTYFVDIYAILDEDTYRQTVSVCGPDGSGCSARNSAPVCSVINANKLFPGADMISTFSFNCAREEPLGETACQAGVYAGCMTAPCYRRPGAGDGTVECLCPNFRGPYQVGQDLPDPASDCDLGPNNVWSAANNVTTGRDGAPGWGGGITPPAPPDGSCVPDSPNPEHGCPLYPVSTSLKPEDPLCELACEQYAQCKRDNQVQVGFTCDATLCTAGCNDQGLVAQACDGLGACAKDAIMKVEELAQCSCCASQICGCDADKLTANQIYVLNQRQRDAGITPQCDVNGTLCGTAPPNAP